jgi:hypothetical protein
MSDLQYTRPIFVLAGTTILLLLTIIVLVHLL